MKIYALIGKSGTGKSYHAPNLVNKMQIDSIVDDGLFIMSGTVIAGISAKRQATTIRAIKTALFMDVEQREKVAKAIKDVAPASLLLIGTSDKMVDLIANRLDISPIDTKIYIEDITNEDQRREAHRQRKEFGMHIIPAPTVQVKKDFSGYFLHPIRSIRDMNIAKHYTTERSVVRPTYSYLGDYSISDIAINDIIIGAAKSVAGVAYLTDIYLKNSREGVRLEISAVLEMVPDMLKVVELLQEEITKTAEKMTVLNVNAVDIIIKGLEKGA